MQTWRCCRKPYFFLKKSPFSHNKNCSNKIFAQSLSGSFWNQIKISTSLAVEAQSFSGRRGFGSLPSTMALFLSTAWRLTLSLWLDCGSWHTVIWLMSQSGMMADGEPLEGTSACAQIPKSTANCLWLFLNWNVTISVYICYFKEAPLWAPEAVDLISLFPKWSNRAVLFFEIPSCKFKEYLRNGHLRGSNAGISIAADWHNTCKWGL